MGQNHASYRCTERFQSNRRILACSHLPYASQMFKNETRYILGAHNCSEPDEVLKNSLNLDISL